MSDEDVHPIFTRNATDPGDSTQRNFRYQHAYGVMLLVAARCGDLPYSAIWCEHHEDFLAQRHDGRFDAYQVKTSRPELGPWTLRSPELVKSIGRFVDLVREFDDAIDQLIFVSNKECDSVTADSTDDRKRGLSPTLFLEHLKGCDLPERIGTPFRAVFDNLQAQCGCQSDALFRVLKCVQIFVGPSRSDFDAVLSHENLPRLQGCADLTPAELDVFRDDLVAAIFRASSLQVTDPMRYLRPLISGSMLDPMVAAKRILTTDILDLRRVQSAPVAFQFLGSPEVVLGKTRPNTVLQEKLKAGGLDQEVEYMRHRELAAEYHLIEDATRRPHKYPGVLRQLEAMVLGECSEAHLRARLNPSPYGSSMMIDVQDRLRSLATDRPEAVDHKSYECLIGMASLLTSECRVWWGPRFLLPSDDSSDR